MAKSKHVNLEVKQLRRSIVNKFQFEEANSHPEFKKGKKKPKRLTTRREKRKLAKQLTKARRIAYTTKQPLDKLYAEILHVKPRREKSDAKIPKEPEENVTKEEMIKQKIEERKQKRLDQMRDLIAEDEKEIKTLAKRLKLNKRKSKTLPKSFVDEGLDYLLELCDSAKRSKNIESEQFDEEKIEEEKDSDGSDQTLESEDSEVESEKEIKKSSVVEKRSKKHVRFEEEETDGSENNEEESDEKTDDDEPDETVDEENEFTEDIYGRLKDKKGNIVQREKLKPIEESKTSVDNEMLKKLLKNIVNRLGEANVQNAVSKINEAYQSHSRNEVKEILTETIFQSCIRSEKVPHRLLFEQSLLLASIHSKISSEITSYFVEHLAVKLRSLRSVDNKNLVDDKSLDNLVLMIVYLFNLKVIQSKLVFDIVRFFLNYFTEKDIELVLIMFQIVGSFLRKDNPTELKSLVDEIRLKLNLKETKVLENQPRVKFMLETLQHLKTDNSVKYFDYDPTSVDHFLKVLRGMMSGKALESSLSMGLQDLWSASTNGRWWIVGSAVVVPSSSQNTAPTVHSTSNLEFSDKLLKLAKKNRMNTDLRRNIFCILMSSEDYLDAFEKLNKLSLKDQQEREIIHIALSCCLKEKRFNSFYVYLIQRFCTDQPRFTLTTQFAVWDKLKILDELIFSAIENLARLLCHLVMNKILSLTALKVIDFAEIQENSQKFLTLFFKQFLLDSTEENLRTEFANCFLQKKFQTFLEGVKLFLNQMFMKRIVGDKCETMLKKRIATIEKYFYYSLDSSLM